MYAGRFASFVSFLDLSRLANTTHQSTRSHIGRSICVEILCKIDSRTIATTRMVDLSSPHHQYCCPQKWIRRKENVTLCVHPSRRSSNGGEIEPRDLGNYW